MNIVTLYLENIYKEKLTQEDLDNLKKLHEYSVKLKDGLNQMEEEINIKTISWADLRRTDNDYVKQVSSIADISFTDIDNNFNEFEGLIYDGAFSEHIELAEKKD